MITYSLQDSGIFLVDFSETVTIADIEKYLTEFKTIKNVPNNFIALYDLRGANLKLKAEDIQLLIELSEKATASLSSVKTAFLVDKPELTASSFLFSVDHNSEKTTRQVFISEQEAISWLKS